MPAASASGPPYAAAFVWSGYLLGFALGGFFDGILLHQILQWHHLLSGLEGETFRDLRVQIVADGLFHGLMYVVAAAGLWLLYRNRRHATGTRADRILVAAVLIGFGAWHLVDAVLSHWLTGIHRIRMDVPDPLFWDVLWLVAFGIVPIAIGLLLRGRALASVAGAAVARFLVAATLLAGYGAALPPRGSGGAPTLAVVLRPDVAPGEFLTAIGQRDDLRIVWHDRAGAVWVFASLDGARGLELYRSGAMYVSGSVLPAGCSAWLRLRG